MAVWQISYVNIRWSCGAAIDKVKVTGSDAAQLQFPVPTAVLRRRSAGPPRRW